MKTIGKPTYRNIVFLFCIIFTIGTSLQGLAQGIDEKVTVVAAFEPTVPEANKLGINPASSETDVPLLKMDYDLKPQPMETSLKADDITAVKLIGEPQKKLYRNYARIGFGNYATPFAEFYANSLRSKTHSLGLYLKHFSSTGVIKNYPISSNSLNIIQLNGEKYFGQHTLSAGIGYKRTVVHHYGFKPADFEEFFPNDDLKQRFNRLNASVGFRSNYSEPDKLNHSVGLAFGRVADLFETSESNAMFSGKADKRFELFDFTDDQVVGLETDVNFTRYKDSTLKQNSTMVSIRPFISTTYEEYSLKLGLNISFQGDSVSKAYLFPFAEGSLRVIDDALVVKAGITGGLRRDGFNTLSELNPFIQSVLPLDYTRERFAFYAGLRARAGKAINLNATIRSSIYDNAAFFVNDFTRIPYNRFTIVYDNASLFTGRFEAEYNESGRINVKAWAMFEKWKMNNELKPWHKPMLSIGGDVNYNIQNKIIAKAGVVVHGKQFAKSFNAGGDVIAKQIKGFADVSLGLEYRYTKLLSAFLNFNNITGSRYYNWNNYPGYRLNLLGGITYSF